MKSLLTRASAALAALALAAAPAAAESWGSKPEASGKVFAAMQAEMSRSLQSLRQDEFGPPYFLAYRLHDARHYEVSATLGAVVGDDLEEYRVAYAEARYGDRAFDNTDLSYQGVSLSAPSDPAVLRHVFWTLTDQAYRGALEGWLEKKAQRSTELDAEPLDDFSAEPPQVKIEEVPRVSLNRRRLRALASRLSAVFRDYPEVYESNVTIGAWWARRFLLTSEGTRLLTPSEEMPQELRISGATRADDGTRLEDGIYLSLRSFSDLPPEAELERQVRAVAAELTAMRSAPVQDAEAAPAILDPEMAGVLFHEGLGHKLEGQRQRDPHESQIFRDMIGKAVLPSFISVYDDPTLKSFKGSPLHGTYEFDSEGSPAQRVALVEKGVLRNFLMSRWPVKGFPSTNGHGRSDWRSHATGRMSNLIVQADGGVPLDVLQKKLLELVRAEGKPYGFLLVGSYGGENPTNRESPQTLEVRPRLTYRVDAVTGARTLVRGVKLVGTPLAVLNRIVAAGDDPTLADGFTCGAESGWVPVSQIAPSLLLSEVEVQRLPEDRARPPILPAPPYDLR
ncbi:MAG TPA: TldD/PmbA family protein [Elusimicrobiota bacterium]|jgi:predicted Zn-dependent protease|nr:TldD/PmbA family protein [Elusimicrobiota bacterium]